MKRAFFLVLLAATAAIMFAGGKGEGGNRASGADTLSIMTIRDPGEGILTEKFVYRLIQESTGVKINVEEIDSEAWWGGERKGLLFATNQLPDLFLGVAFTPQEEVGYGLSGQLIPLNPLIEKVGPETKKMFAQYPYVRSAVTTPDGNIYVMPINNPQPTAMVAGGRFWFNTQWLKEANVPIPNTLDEFYNALTVFKRRGNNIIPVGGTYSYHNISQVILNALGYVENGFTLNKSGNGIVFVPAQPEYKEYLQFMKRLWDNGLLDKEYFTQTEDAYIAKGTQMRYGLFHHGAHYLMLPEGQYEQYEIIPPMTSSFNNTRMTAKSDGIDRGVAAITNKSKNPEAAYKLIDWCYSYEGTLAVQGVTDKPVWDGKGTYYTMDNGKFRYQWPSNYGSFWEYNILKIGHYKMPFNINSFWDNLYQEPTEVSFTKNMMDGLVKYAKFGYPKVYFTKAQNDIMLRYQADRDSYIEQMDAKFITGEVSLNEFDNYVRTLNTTLGVPETIKVYEDAYAAYQRNSR